jgi:hypothetical protein
MPDREHARSLLSQQALDFRHRAEEFRIVSETTRSAEARRVLRDLATKADQMAATIESQLDGLAVRC